MFGGAVVGNLRGTLTAMAPRDADGEGLVLGNLRGTLTTLALMIPYRGTCVGSLRGSLTALVQWSASSPTSV